MNDKEAEENYLVFMKNSIELYKNGGIEAVNTYLKAYGTPEIPKDKEEGFYQELERAWIIETFWVNDYIDLMNDNQLYRTNLINLLKLMSKSYELHGKDGIKYFIGVVSNDYNIHEFLLNRLEEKCKGILKISGYIDSMPQNEIEIDGEKIKVVDAFIVYNFLDTDLSYDEWIEQNRDDLYLRGQE